MYRSQSTSSVFIDALYQVNPEVNLGSNERDFNNVHYKSPVSELYEPEMTYREPEMTYREPEMSGATMSTLTSALTGSKMATTVQLPTSAGTRPLPKALLPKTVRTPASPPVMGGTVFARTPPKPSDGRRSSFSYTPVNTLPRHPVAHAPGGWAAPRQHSASVSSAVSRPSSGRSYASVKTEVPDADDSPLGGKQRAASSSSSSSPGAQSVSHVTRPVVIRRREPIEEDSIYPLLKAALGKDREAENRRTEEEISRQVFGRSGRVFSTGVSPAPSSPARPSTPLMSPRNIYSSVDDVFVSSSWEGMTSPRAGTLPHSHAKSSSEVIMSTYPILPRQPWRQIPTQMKGGNDPDHPRHSGRTPSRSTTEPDYIGSVSPSRPPPLPPTSPPPDFTEAIPAPDHRLSTRVVACENLCRAPISVEPRKVIRNPRRNAPHPTNSPQPLYGKSLPADSFPLLARVDRHLLDGESEFVDTASRTSKIQNTGFVDLDLKRGERFHQTVPPKSIDPATDDSLLPPPLGFRDTITSSSSSSRSPVRTTTASSTANGAHFQMVRHQATDSVNTEDSGLDRWEKEEEEDTADDDEMDAASDRTAIAPTAPISAAADERGSPSTEERGGGGGGQWREDQSEGRGSLTSSPRPHSADYTSLSVKEEEGVSYSSTRQLDLISNESPPGEGNVFDGRRVASNGILSHLLAENSASYRQTPHSNIYHRSDHHHHHHHHHLDDADEVKRSGGGGEEFGPRCVRLPSSDLDSENSHCLSTAAQPPSVAASDDTLERISAETADDSLRSTAEQNSADDFLVHSGKTDLQRDLETIEPWNRRSWFGESEKQRPEEPTGMKDGADGGGDMVVDIVKGPVGVGFCIEGGRGSLSGDRPILVKRLFKGGLAESLVDLRPGDELVSVGGQSLQGFSHYDAWKFIKALPNGTVQLTIRRT